jgi:hypothetical protein
MHFLGIDPGKEGAFAIIDEHRHGIVLKMPKTGERDVRDLIVRIVEEFNGPSRPLERLVVGLEYEHAWPGRGATSTWTFAQGYGFLRGVLTAIDVAFEEIPPRTWMRVLGIRKSGTSKSAMYARARLWFPHLKVSKDTADSVLIAEFLRRSWAREPPEEMVEAEAEGEPTGL